MNGIGLVLGVGAQGYDADSTKGIGSAGGWKWWSSCLFSRKSRVKVVWGTICTCAVVERVAELTGRRVCSQQVKDRKAGLFPVEISTGEGALCVRFGAWQARQVPFSHSGWAGLFALLLRNDEMPRKKP